MHRLAYPAQFSHSVKTCRYGLGNKTITCPAKAHFKVSNEVGEKRVVTVITIKRRIALKACENICFD